MGIRERLLWALVALWTAVGTAGCVATQGALDTLSANVTALRASVAAGEITQAEFDEKVDELGDNTKALETAFKEDVEDLKENALSLGEGLTGGGLGAVAFWIARNMTRSKDLEKVQKA